MRSKMIEDEVQKEIKKLRVPTKVRFIYCKIHYYGAMFILGCTLYKADVTVPHELESFWSAQY